MILRNCTKSRMSYGNCINRILYFRGEIDVDYRYKLEEIELYNFESLFLYNTNKPSKKGFFLDIQLAIFTRAFDKFVQNTEDDRCHNWHNVGC